MNPSKLLLIFKREYLTRIKRKSFIWSTILVPVGFLLIISIPLIMTIWDSDTVYKIALVDKTETGVYERFQEENNQRYLRAETDDEDQLREMITSGELDGYLVITEQNIEEDVDPRLLYKGAGIDFVQSITGDVEEVIRDERLSRISVSDEVRSVLKKEPGLTRKKLSDEGKAEEDNSFALSAMGYIMAFLIYGAMFGYGAIIMRSVIEEKTNRIVEIIASSVKPVELMIGKVLGVGALGLTQFTIWIIASIAIFSGLAPFVTSLMTPDTAEAGQQAAAGFTMPEINPIIWVYFLIYYLLGYLIYSALFAAVGSAVDSESDSQQLQIPLTIPIIIAIVIMPKVITDPDSTFAIVSSLIPIFSPILMVARIPITTVPFWQIGLSFLLMGITIYLFLVMSAKIYRVGILMYGKKVSFKELGKWLRY